MTLLKFSDGNETKRCDAKCHLATRAKCDCICGGVFHAQGLKHGKLEEAIERYGRGLIAKHKGDGVDTDGLKKFRLPLFRESSAYYEERNEIARRDAGKMLE